MNAILATNCFSRTKENKQFYTQMITKGDQQGDRVFFQEAPGSDAVAFYNRQGTIQRTEGEKKAKTNQMLFSGTGGFLAQKIFNEQKDLERRENVDAANQFAKMRFNI